MRSPVPSDGPNTVLPASTTTAIGAPVMTVATPTANAVLLRPRIFLSVSSAARDVAGARATAIIRQMAKMQRIIDPVGNEVYPGPIMRGEGVAGKVIIWPNAAESRLHALMAAG